MTTVFCIIIYQIPKNILFLILKVAVNGYFMFGGQASNYSPQLFQPVSFQYDNTVAPFWADNDVTQVNSSASYEVHNDSISPVLLTQVSIFISQQHQVNFTGTWMIVAEWFQVAQSGGSANIVSRETEFVTPLPFVIIAWLRNTSKAPPVPLYSVWHC